MEHVDMRDMPPGTRGGEAMSKQEWGYALQHLDGFTWGITETGETVCLGNEQAVKAALGNPKLHSCIEEIDHCIDLERKLIREENENNGQPADIKHANTFRAIKARNQRNRPATPAKHRAASFKRATA